MNTRPDALQRRGFTRLELLATLSALALLCLVTLPLLAQGKPRSELAICLNNLRQVGRALLAWNADHGGSDPWRVPYPDGNRDHPSGLNNNLWFQYTAISNELRTPKILACPSDGAARVASDFSTSANGGYLNASFRNEATSYFLGLDSFAQSPQTVLSGDPHLRLGPMSACSSGIAPVSTIDYQTVGWNLTNVHGAVGHLLFHDGRVELRSSTGARLAFQSLQTESDNLSWHILAPRPSP